MLEEVKKSLPGFWTSKACAYSDSRDRCPVLAATPNEGDAIRNGFIHYLILKDNEARLQVGAVIPSNRASVQNVMVPSNVAEKAILAAMEVVVGWYYCNEPDAKPDSHPLKAV